MKNPIIRWLVVGLVAVVLAGGVAVWMSTTSSGAAARYVTALASTGDVSAAYTATGKITRDNSSKVSFSVTGTVKKVDVAVGDAVTAGQRLAVLNTTALQLAVLNAETSVAQAKASLYSAQHPASASSSTSAKGGVTIDPKALAAAVQRVNAAAAAEAAACDPVLAALGSTTSGSAAASTSTSSTVTASPSATATSTASAAPSDAALQACADARGQVTAANAELTKVVAAITKPGAGHSSSGSSQTTVSKSAVAKAKASLLQANQDLTTAQKNLDAAELVAPISGTVGLVTLSVGSSASSGAITIVGDGVAKITFELPLAQRQKVSVGSTVSVNPAGSTSALSGRISSIATLATSGTSGDSPTYTTTVTASDPKDLLATGAKASVQLSIASASNVVRVPASAVTPTGTGTATVSTVTSATASTSTTVTVKTGVVGGGWVQITEGVSAGQLVVLADRTAAIPTNSTTRRTTSTASSTRSSGSTAPSAVASSATQPSSTPSK